MSNNMIHFPRSFQLQQPPMIPPSMRPIANCINLRFDDFIIIDSIGLVVGKSVFHQAIWQNSVYVTLVLTSDSNQMVSGVCSELNQMTGGVTGALKLITEFCDVVPNNYLPSMPTTKVQMVQGWCWTKYFYLAQLTILCSFSYHNCTAKT